jgi:phenylalanine ammonia-lyase
MALFGIEPVVLGPKEGLGLINGTAVSASFATLALHDSQHLALLSQALTALTVEAMVGQQGSFHPFLHDTTRPHPQQIEVAKNIRTLLKGSSFAMEKEEEVAIEEDTGILRQDRFVLFLRFLCFLRLHLPFILTLLPSNSYALRTSPQVRLLLLSRSPSVRKIDG